MNKDIILISRPDHSFSIYQSLLRSGLSFLYVSFKLFPRWLRPFIRDTRARYFSSHYSNCLRVSLVHLLRVFTHNSRLKRLERPFFLSHLRHLLPFYNADIIHYWPNYSLEAIKKYRRGHPKTITIADIYFPCEQWVLDNVKPVLDSFGVETDYSEIICNASRLRELMGVENRFFVPSEFIANTYRCYYPDKEYIIVPYGIQLWEGYKKKQHIVYAASIRSFVYVGTISVEKGCDLLLAFFASHPEYELHLFGNIHHKQNSIFESFKEYSNLFFHGSIPKADIQQTVAQYDVGIHLSRYDAYGLAVGEVLGAGLPVIVSEYTGISDLVKSVGCGCVVGLNQELQSVINELSSPECYNRYIDNLDQYISSSPVSYGDCVITKYKDILAAKNENTLSI